MELQSYYNLIPGPGEFEMAVIGSSIMVKKKGSDPGHKRNRITEIRSQRTSTECPAMFPEPTHQWRANGAKNDQNNFLFFSDIAACGMQ
jgi:hypothetical protein